MVFAFSLLRVSYSLSTDVSPSLLNFKLQFLRKKSDILSISLPTDSCRSNTKFSFFEAQFKPLIGGELEYRCLRKQHSAAYKFNSFEWLKILLTINEIHLQLGRIAIPRNSPSELSVIGKLGKLIMIDKINYEIPNAFNWIHNICYCHKCSPIYMGKVMRTCCL